MEQVAAFYSGSGELLAAITQALNAAGIHRDAVTTKDLATVDEFHIRGREATLEIADALLLTPESHVLDLGSGLGGPARTIAEIIGCRVTGIDLTPEFCEVATALSEWAGLHQLVSFRVGDATATELATASVDAVMTIHVAMNIPDKDSLYREARRVLRPGGRFVIYDVLQGDGGEVHYPVPWASDASLSFVATPEETRELLAGAGFTVVSERDSSAQSLAWFQQLRAKIDRDGPPAVTFSAFLGESFGQMASNQVLNLAEDRIRTVMFVCA